MDNSDSESIPQGLRKVRGGLNKKIAELELQRLQLMSQLSKYPPMPTTITEQMLREQQTYTGITQEIGRLKGEVSNLTLLSLEDYLSSIAVDSKRIRLLTIALVTLTIVLSVFAGLDFLARIGIIK